MEAGSREYLAIRLNQLARMWRTEADRCLSPFHLTEARWRVLLQLSRYDGPVIQTELAQAVGIQGPTLVRTLGWLEERGLIERRAIKGDRRAKSVHLTNKARPKLEAIQTVLKQLRDELFEGVSEAEIKTCLSVFERLSARLESASTRMPGPGVDEAEK